MVALIAVVTGVPEGVDDFERVEQPLVGMLGRRGDDLRAQLFGRLVDVEFAQQIANGRRADVGREGAIAFFLRLRAQREVFVLVQQLALFDLMLARLDDDVVGVIDDLLEVTERDVEQVANRTGEGIEEPDMGNGYGELDVPHALAAHLRQGHFDAASIADHPTIADALVLAAMAFPVLDGTEDALAEQAVLFRFERPVVDGLGLGDFAPRPPGPKPLKLEALALLWILRTTDLFGRSDSNLDVVERAGARLTNTAKINHDLFLASAAVFLERAAVAITCLPHRDPDAQRLQLLHEHIERLGNSRLWQVLPLHDGFIHSAATVHIVGLDGENLLERVRGTVRLERPHFHLSETLAAELRLTGQRLLRDERVRADAPRVDLVVHDVRQFQHRDFADGHRRGERFARTAVAQLDLSKGVQSGETHQIRRRGVHVRIGLLAEHSGERRQLLLRQHVG